jgi:hypothetical protein
MQSRLAACAVLARRAADTVCSRAALVVSGGLSVTAALTLHPSPHMPGQNSPIERLQARVHRWVEGPKEELPKKEVKSWISDKSSFAGQMDLGTLGIKPGFLSNPAGEGTTEPAADIGRLLAAWQEEAEADPTKAETVLLCSLGGAAGRAAGAGGSHSQWSSPIRCYRRGRGLLAYSW